MATVHKYWNRKIYTNTLFMITLILIPSEMTPAWQNDPVSILVCLHSPLHLTVIFPLLVCSQGISSREDRDDLVRSSSHTPSNKAQILAMPQFGLRDNLIRCELLKNEDLYTYREPFRYVTLNCFLCLCLIMCLADWRRCSGDCGTVTHHSRWYFG